MHSSVNIHRHALTMGRICYSVAMATATPPHLQHNVKPHRCCCRCRPRRYSSLPSLLCFTLSFIFSSCQQRHCPRRRRPRPNLTGPLGPLSPTPPINTFSPPTTNMARPSIILPPNKVHHLQCHDPSSPQLRRHYAAQKCLDEFIPTHHPHSGQDISPHRIPTSMKIIVAHLNKNYLTRPTDIKLKSLTMWRLFFSHNVWQLRSPTKDGSTFPSRHLCPIKARQA
jgi:hypothetical protein